MSNIATTQNEAPFEGYLTIRAAVDHSGYSDQYIRRLMRKQKLHGIKVGHLWLVTVESLDAYLDGAASRNDRRYGPRPANGFRTERSEAIEPPQKINR
jgi:hypothetical protein